MPYRFRLTSNAKRELDKEIAYSVKHWGKHHAKKYRQELLAVIKRIADNPFSYPEHTGIKKGYRVVSYKGNYIVYSVNESEQYIEIVAFPGIYRDFQNEE
jgi:plasmid stabilization system protein ParE